VTDVVEYELTLIVRISVADESQPAAFVNPVSVYVPEVVYVTAFQV
jgi:hypothetical protein